MDQVGELYCERTLGEQARIRSASPVIWVTGQFLECASPRFVNVDGDVLTLRDSVGKSFVYVIDRASYEPDSDRYIARWPD